MFRLLSKESNIFSIPVYIGFLLLIVIAFNVFNFNTLEVFSAVITFLGIALGYFCFNTIALNYSSHLPLFLYTFFVFGLYPGHLDIGISSALLTNSFILFILTSTDEDFRKNSYLLVGAIMALNFILLPVSWPMIIFVILHIFGTSQRIGLNLFRYLFGATLIILSYLGLMYFFNFRSLDSSYFPFNHFKLMTDYYPLYFLLPVFLMMIYAVMDHFKHFNKKSPISKYKYSFILIFSLAQLVTVFLYMGKNYEFLLLLTLPASIILSRTLRFMKKSWIQELGLWLIILCLITFKIANYVDLSQIF